MAGTQWLWGWQVHTAGHRDAGADRRTNGGSYGEPYPDGKPPPDSLAHTFTDSDTLTRAYAVAGAYALSRPHTASDPAPHTNPGANPDSLACSHAHPDSNARAERHVHRPTLYLESGRADDQ